MAEFDIEKKKLELFSVLMELETEISVLSKNIEKARADLDKVQTMEDAKEFDKNNDLENGLKHIQLF